MVSFICLCIPADVSDSRVLCHMLCHAMMSCLLLSTTLLQHLMERSWHAMIDTCLAFTLFREDFSPQFVAVFSILLFIKCFHWLAEDRIDFVRLCRWLYSIRLMRALVPRTRTRDRKLYSNAALVAELF